MTHPAPDGDDPGDVVAPLLETYRLLVAVTASSMEAIAETLTAPQFRMLTVLNDHGPANLSRLARYLGVHPSTTMRMINRMTGTGMIRRVAPPGGRHETQIVLTDAGRATVRYVGERRCNEIKRLAGQMPLAVRRDLVRALRAFNRGARTGAATPPSPGRE